jgi:hypothetical protein
LPLIAHAVQPDAASPQSLRVPQSGGVIVAVVVMVVVVVVVVDELELVVSPQSSSPQPPLPPVEPRPLSHATTIQPLAARM